MCGIAGCVLGRGATPSWERLAAARDALAHRGPDDWGIEVIDSVGLVHTRLAIVELSERGHQPMAHPDGAWWLTYNGEIYNHAQLRLTLERRGARFRGSSDTETLLWALARWGDEAFAKLSGQFAFAALDLRRQRVILCRDRLGVKPLYLARIDGGLWWASEPSALLAAGACARPLPSAWRDLCDGAYLEGERTLLEGIVRLDPGSWVSISLADACATKRRWHRCADDVDPASAARLQARSRSQLTDVLEATVRRAVHRTLLADTAVGTLCSGGVDSSLITALAAERIPGLVAFGASHPADGRHDEGLAARRVAESLGVALELVEVTPASWRSAFVAATVHSGAPIANGSEVTVALLAQRAQACGVKVLLTGEGADELFGGYDLLHATALASFLPWPGRLIHAAELEAAAEHLRRLGPMRTAKTPHASGPARAEGWLRAATGPICGPPRSLAALCAARRALARSLSPPPPSRELALRAPSSAHSSDPQALAAYAHHAGRRAALEAALLGHLDYSLCWLLNRMDKNVMQSSVEARVPFLEPDVVALALNLPLSARVGPWSKGILRDVARRLLPVSIAHRPKIYGMAFDARTWIEQAADPRFLTQGTLREALKIPAERFQRALQADNRVLRLRLWSAEVWCRATLAGSSVAEIERELWREDPSRSLGDGACDRRATADRRLRAAA